MKPSINAVGKALSGTKKDCTEMPQPDGHAISNHTLDHRGTAIEVLAMQAMCYSIDDWNTFDVAPFAAPDAIESAKQAAPEIVALFNAAQLSKTDTAVDPGFSSLVNDNGPAVRDLMGRASERAPANFYSVRRESASRVFAGSAEWRNVAELYRVKHLGLGLCTHVEIVESICSAMRFVCDFAMTSSSSTLAPLRNALCHALLQLGDRPIDQAASITRELEQTFCGAVRGVAAAFVEAELISRREVCEVKERGLSEESLRVLCERAAQGFVEEIHKDSGWCGMESNGIELRAIEKVPPAVGIIFVTGLSVR